MKNVIKQKIENMALSEELASSSFFCVAEKH